MGRSFFKPATIKRTLFPAGRHIFIFRHSRTNQVIYSLHHNIDGKNEKNVHAQLPFLGKKTKPAEIRTDLWLPYARVDFPKTSTWKGLLTYRKLREYQMLRYYSWRTKGQSSQESRRTRITNLMDQSRTSVADLANVLSESEGWEAAKEERRTKAVQSQRNKYDAIWANTVQRVEEGKAGKLQEATDAIAKARNSKEANQARQEVNKYKRAQEAVDAVNGSTIDEVARSRWTPDMAKMVEYKLTGNIEGYTDEPAEALEASTSTSGETSKPDSTSSVEAVTDSLARLNPLTSGSIKPIQIRWKDIRDAQWAQSWPATIQHDQIGYTMASMPFGPRTQPPVLDPAERVKDPYRLRKMLREWEFRRKQLKPPPPKSHRVLDPEAQAVLESLEFEDGSSQGVQQAL